MKIAFFWTWEFSKNICTQLLNDFAQEIEIKLIISQPDKPVWRKKIMTKTPIKILAETKQIQILQPENLKPHTQNTQNLITKLTKNSLDFIVVVAYGKIIPKEILQIPKYGCINIHGSILPKYRWASPIQTSIKNWEKETGITIMYMSESMDTGDILATQKIPITPEDRTENIFSKFEDIWPPLLVKTLQKIINNSIHWKKQNHSDATYCSKIQKNDGKIDFTNETAEEIYNKFRAYSSWPWIYSFYKGKKINIQNCELSTTNTNNIPKGSVIRWENKIIWVVCKKWFLILKEIKLEWKKSIDILDFINGNKEFLHYKFTPCST